MIDSSTGGYLAPLPTTPPLEGEALDNFLHDLVAGVTGMDVTRIFPRWQPEPPNLPPAGTPWCAVGVTSRPSDTYPYIGHQGAGQGSSQMQRHETLNILASFYDLGAGGQADALAALFRDGLSISQNREQLMLNGFAFVSTGEPLAVPSLLKERWQYRCDLPFVLRRALVRSYGILNLEEVDATLNTQNPGLTLPVTITPPE